MKKTEPISLKKGQERKERVTEAVIEALAAKGIHHTTFESIGKIAKMERSHLVYYFANHDEMIQGAVEKVASTAQSLTRKNIELAKTPEEKLFAIIHSVFEHIEKHPKHAAALTVFYHFCTVDKSSRQIHSAIREVGVERLTSVLRELNPKRAEKDYYRLAKGIQNILFGSLLEWMTTNSARSLNEMEKEVRSFILSLLSIK